MGMKEASMAKKKIAKEHKQDTLADRQLQERRLCETVIVLVSEGNDAGMD